MPAIAIQNMWARRHVAAQAYAGEIRGGEWYGLARRGLLHLVYLYCRVRRMLMRVLNLTFGGYIQPAAEDGDGKHADDHPEHDDDKNWNDWAHNS